MSDDRTKNLAEKLRKNLGVKAFAGTNLELASSVSFGVPTGLPMLDLALHRPGLPAGRVVEIYGKEHCGKTALAYSVIAQAQMAGGLAVYIDTERSLEEDRVRACGVDIDNLLVSEADTVDDVFLTIQNVLEQAEPATASSPLVICVDSITAVECRSNHERAIGEEPIPGADARVIKRGVKKINPLLSEKNALLLFINHAFHKMNVMAFQKQTESTGGLSLKYMSSVRLELAQGGNLFDGTGADKERLGMKTAIDVVKNKVAHTNKPKVKEVAVTENGFDLYAGLWDGFLEIGAIEKVNNQNYTFIPGETTMGRKEWPAYVDKKQDGLYGMYRFFLKAAIEHGHIKRYKSV